jgi:hypothetical protein
VEDFVGFRQGFYAQINWIDPRRKAKWQKKTPDPLRGDSGVDGADH